MRWVLASLASLAVLAATLPVVCGQGEFDNGSCQSAIYLPVFGNAAQGDDWAAALALSLAVWTFRTLSRRRSGRGV
jgi:hypothetical protein